MQFKKTDSFTDIMSINPIVDFKFLELPNSLFYPSNKQIEIVMKN